MEPYGLSLLERYPEAWKIFLAVFWSADLLTGLLYFLAKKKNLLPAIRDRDVHTKRKPRVGGVAMWFVAISAIGLIATLRPDLLSFGDVLVAGLSKVLWGVIAGMFIILAFGLLDDLIGLKPRYQLLGQFLAATALILGGLQVAYIRMPFQYMLHLDGVAWHIGTLIILPLSALFTYLWIITMINVMNFFDGLDGLAGSVAMTASLILLLVSLRLGFTGAATLCIILFGISSGFLPWNWYPSKLFMGTVGSQLLGFLLGVVAIISGAKVATAVLVLGVPVFDAFVVIIRRLIAKKSPFEADQRHLHHRLLKVGLSVPWVVVVTNLVAVIFGVLALRNQTSNTKGLLTGALILCMLGFILATYLLERRVSKRVN